jgi:hypothetical protein
VQVTLPEGAAAVVRLPAGKLAPIVTGASPNISQEGAEFVIELPAGAEATMSSAG